MSQNLLTTINDPKDLRLLSIAQLAQVAKELREFIITIVATKEGHLGASLGVVELTIALHYCFDTPYDQLIWDVGHQAYPHKILTGRRDTFHTNRQFDGISGFPKRSESKYDAFGTGHASTAISAALGMAMASRIKGDEKKQHIAVVGDASIAGGMAFEGLNHAGVTDANLLVILNDNAIGIDPSVGALTTYLAKARSGEVPKKYSLFEALNFEYYGPVDGHDLPELVRLLVKLKKKQGRILLHVITTKGKGLRKAEEQQITYHAPGKFDQKTGDLLPKAKTTKTKFQDVFGYTLLELAAEDERIVGITPAMPTGSSLKYMMEAFPERAFDVGIAEQHAVTLCAGMATQGLLPFCTIYATFLQRGYDQLIHDVALQNLAVVICIDRAGLVGADGATHHGVFDIAMIRCVPNVMIASPRDEIQLRNLLYTVTQELSQPIVIRYPRGYGHLDEWKLPFKTIPYGKGTILKEGSEIAVITVGTIATEVTKAIALLTPEDQKRVGHYDSVFVKPLDQELLHTIFKNYTKILTVEEGTVVGGFGSGVNDFLQKHAYSNTIRILGVPDKFVQQGTMEELYEVAKLSSTAIRDELQALLQE